MLPGIQICADLYYYKITELSFGQIFRNISKAINKLFHIMSFIRNVSHLKYELPKKLIPEFEENNRLLRSNNVLLEYKICSLNKALESFKSEVTSIEVGTKKVYSANRRV